MSQPLPTGARSAPETVHNGLEFEEGPELEGRPRVLVVSAHFPPDFVSGGTLAPERLARGLQARGYEVSVYAGHLDGSRPPLSTWTTDEAGLSVRWITITPWTAWTDPRNHDNPQVVDDFVRHLAEVKPDIVHLHSIQTLGAGLLAAAKAAGATTVVTMHDFWWCCARQFLVDQQWRPCSVVVDAGVCECAAGRASLEARNAWLRDQLHNADRVLAVSQITADVLAANGVPADRLAVDENGLPDEATPLADAAPLAATAPAPSRPGPVPDEATPLTTAPAPSDAPALPGAAPGHEVRFVYAGGPNQMKGSHVLLEAARRLADRPGWRLDAYGMADAARTTWRGAPPAVRCRPSFTPTELDDVLGGADVVIVPSLRETHSLITREALLRGAAVICTDSLGPEEVVEHGRNGLIVPTGDADLLAEAMARVIDDRTELARLRRGTDVRVRTLSEQLDGLEGHYAELMAARHAAAPAAPEPAPPARPTIREVLFICGIDGAPLRYRAHLPAEALALRGVASTVAHYRDVRLPELLRTADAVVVYRAPATVQLLELLAGLQRDRPQVPLVFDVDDLIFDPDLTAEVPALAALAPDELALYVEGLRRYRTTMEACDLYVGSTAMLCEHATAVTGLPSERYANGVGIVLGQASDRARQRPRAEGPVRIGYLSGTTTHDRDWAEVEPAVLEVMGRHPDVELWLGGHLNPSPAIAAVGDRVRRLPLLDWRELPDVLRDLDVNLAPLEPQGRFNEAKSAIKWLEAALTETPTIATPTEPFREAIEHGVSGFLAGDHDAWVAALDLLVTDAATRARVGRRARRDALLRWSPHRQADRYLEILEAARTLVADGRSPRPHSGYELVALDEPLLTVGFQPYGPDPAAALAPALPSGGRVQSAVRARLDTWERVRRTEGGRAALRGTARAVARDATRVARALARRARAQLHR